MKALIGVTLALMAAAQPARADCECLGNGTRYAQGQVACLKLPTGPVLARCEKVLNNSSWKRLQNGCPEARVPQRPNGSVAAAGQNARKVMIESVSLMPATEWTCSLTKCPMSTSSSR
jgi:hypothetical protein